MLSNKKLLVDELNLFKYKYPHAIIFRIIQLQFIVLENMIAYKLMLLII